MSVVLSLRNRPAVAVVVAAMLQRGSRGHRVARRIAAEAKAETDRAIAWLARARSRTQRAALPARRGRPLGEWIAELREYRAREGYRRSAAPSPEELWRILENVASDENTRAAAAVALSAKPNEAAKVRLRRIAEASADEDLRDLLLAIHTESPELLSMALEAIEK